MSRQENRLQHADSDPANSPSDGLKRTRRDLGDKQKPKNPTANQASLQESTISLMMEILKKGQTERSEDDKKLMEEWSFLAPEAESRLKARLAKNVLKQRSVEQEESMESIERKAEILAQLIRDSNYTVIYTGAGISTSALIPDYRGPNGLWTQIRKTGSFSITRVHDLTSAEPTLTHMAIRELCQRRIVNHVVSQNCDGLHLRSGIPQTRLSEIHGNMYIEVCPTCEKQYFRQADITERTSRFRHKTGRKCHRCVEPNNNLIDTIVLYGERSRTMWPMNWERAGRAAKKADLIICLGSSLKTLRRYSCLWPKRPTNSAKETAVAAKLAIINLQYTSKDKNALLKINGKCDLVMQLVMQQLNIDVPAYDWLTDPLREMAVPFSPEERRELKGNLISESLKARQLDGSPNLGASSEIPVIESSKSPSLFISELTDDPNRKRLRMRIRAVNLGESPDLIPPSSSSTSQHLEIDQKGDDRRRADLALIGVKNRNDTTSDTSQISIKADYVLPGWLGKSLGSVRTSSYRRKRHGNKGRRPGSHLKANQQNIKAEPTNEGGIVEIGEQSHIKRESTHEATSTAEHSAVDLADNLCSLTQKNESISEH